MTEQLVVCRLSPVCEEETCEHNGTHEEGNNCGPCECWAIIMGVDAHLTTSCLPIEEVQRE